MLGLCIQKNRWKPPKLGSEVWGDIISTNYSADGWKGRLYVVQTEPYIDVVLEYFGDIFTTRRFVFHDDYVWRYEEEKFFEERCLRCGEIDFDYGAFDTIYKYYSSLHPEWHLKRYYTDSIRLLDHIYHCMRKNTVKELLYKCGLDVLAKHSSEIDDLDMLASNPSEIYDGVPVRILKAMNCDSGAKMLCEKKYRDYIKELGYRYSKVFDGLMNDAQCEYLKYLYDRGLTIKEIGRFYSGRSRMLANLWNRRQYDEFVCKTVRVDHISELIEIDPIYEAMQHGLRYDTEIGEVMHYLLDCREEYDRRVRVSNRKRKYDWQERDHGYVIRYPQTINDICREAVFMRHCLLGYTEEIMDNVTTILFMRRIEAVNEPYITIEIYNNELTQAYKRFDKDCSSEEAEWIREYCGRHGIIWENFYFDVTRDRVWE